MTGCGNGRHARQTLLRQISRSAVAVELERPAEVPLYTAGDAHKAFTVYMENIVSSFGLNFDSPRKFIKTLVQISECSHILHSSLFQLIH